MKNKWQKIMVGYLICFGIFILIYCSVRTPKPKGEWDDYSLPVASVLNDHNFSISDQDVVVYKQLFPEWAGYIDTYSLSGYTVKNGSGEMPWYFPTYSVACIPITLLLKALGLPAIYAFAYTNLTVLLLSLIFILYCLKTSEVRKALLIAALSINPIVFYVSWASAEVFIYAMLVMGLASWYNQWHKRAALFVSIAGMLNPTIMSIGLIMIVKYAVKLLLAKNKDISWFNFIKANISEVAMYGCCYLIGLIPMAYNYYNIGYINLTASLDSFTHGKESTVSRLWSYLFDLNYGILPYFAVLLLVGIMLIIPAVRKKHWDYLEWMFTFLLNIALYSVMIHINCGMSGIARYNSWGVLLLIFPVIMFFDEIIHRKQAVKGIRIALSAGIVITGIVVMQYGPDSASNTSHVRMTPIAEWVLKKAPNLYNPLHSTFNSRTIHQDGGYNYETPVVYVDKDSYVRKILATADDKEQILSEYLSLNGKSDWLKDQVSKLDKEESYISIPGEYKIVKILEYTLGNPITFTSEGYNAEDYVAKGLSVREDWGSWTEGDEFILRFKTNSDCAVISGEINSRVYNKAQDVTVYINDEKVYEQDNFAGGTLQFNFRNPGYMQLIEIKVEIPNAISPVEFGYSDSRVLGLGIYSMMFTEAKALDSKH